jgi:hypothetical protein
MIDINSSGSGRPAVAYPLARKGICHRPHTVFCMTDITVTGVDRGSIRMDSNFAKEADVVATASRPNPDLELYTDLSGKNAFELVARVLKGE